MSTTRIYLAIFLTGIVIFLNCITIKALLKTKADLTKVSGRIQDKYLVTNEGKSPYKAWILVVENSTLKYAVQDRSDRAFNYIKDHDIMNATATVLYDPSGTNFEPDITYHVFDVKIDDVEIMTLSESKKVYKFGLGLTIALDLFLIGVFYYRQKS